MLLDIDNNSPYNTFMSEKNILEEFTSFIKQSELMGTSDTSNAPAPVNVPTNTPRVNAQSPLSSDVNPPITSNNSTLKNHTSNAPLKNMKNFSSHIG
jgi:hypothetical protein